MVHALVSGSPFVDHINGNGLDNRRANLRPSNKQLNAANGRGHRDGTSPYKGVSWYRGKWRAVLHVDGKQQWVGMFVDEVAAAEAYDAAATAAFGEHARLNFMSAGGGAARL